MDEFQEERDKIKKAPLKAKLKYFADYYLLKTLIILGVAALVIGVVVTIVTKKDNVLYVTLVDFSDIGLAENEIQRPFTQLYVADPKKEEITLDCILQSDASRAESSEPAVYGISYEDEMRLTMLLANDVDLLIAGTDIIEKYGANDYLMPLQGVYDQAQMEEFEKEGRIYYIDGEAMAVRLEGVELLRQNYVYIGPGRDQAEIYAAFPFGGDHRDMALHFIDFIRGNNNNK
ncbi:MAG: hypothetical protein K5697_15495 [Lachnospiraceae bacterium]|nr:hypothetical protein [Lachnospiraceae bacterium]